MENSQRKGKEDFDKLVLANSKFVAQQNETNEQLANLTRQQEMSENNIKTFANQMTVLATHITNLGKKQESDSKSIMETMKSFSTQLFEMNEKINNMNNNNNNNSLSSTFPPYPQLMSQHHQHSEMLLRAQYSHGPGPGCPPPLSTLGINYNPVQVPVSSQLHPANTSSPPQTQAPTNNPDQAFVSPQKNTANPSDKSHAMDTEETNRKRGEGSSNTPPNTKKINSNPHIVQDKLKQTLELQKQEEESLSAQTQTGDDIDPPGTQPVEGLGL